MFRCGVSNVNSVSILQKNGEIMNSASLALASGLARLATTISARAAARPHLWMLLSLTLLTALLSGCVMQPVVAGPLQQAPLPTDQGPIIAIAPIAAASGDTVSVSGAGWEPDEVIFINLEGIQDGVTVQATLATGAADADGRFYLAFVTPLDFFWQDVIDLQIVAYSLQSGATATAPFALLAASATVTPTATLPLTPTIVATPTSPQTGGSYGIATVTSRGLNMRSGPGTLYPILRSLVRGAPITVMGQDATGLWLYGQLADGLLGWVARAYTNYLGAPPVMPAPPTPVYRPTATPTPVPTAAPGLGWQGEYYTNPSLQGAPRVVREDSAINFNWGYSAPAPGIPATGFSVRWFRTLYFSEGVYRLFGQSDGGVNVWVDNRLVLDQWHGVNGAYSVDVWLHQGTHTFFVDYGQRRQPSHMSFWWELTGPTPAPSFPEWRGEYFNNRDLTGNPVHVRNDQHIDFNWSGISPAPGLDTENYSVRWSRTLDFSSGDYRFHIRSDDGSRVFVDGNRIINEWRDMGGGTTYTADRYLSGHHTIVVEYYQHTGSALVHFWWERINATPTPTRTPTPTATPATRNPYADANPSSGQTGSQVTVSFGGFPANTAVNLYLGGYVRAADAASSTIYASGASDRFGNGSISFTVPATWPDGSSIQSGKLALLVATINFGVSAATDFDVRAPRPTVAPNPFVEVNPGSGGPGTQVTVRGGGFPANTTVSVYLGGVVRASVADAAPIVTTSSDGNGNFSTSFTMPTTWTDGSAIATGKLIVVAATDDFSVQASASFDFFATPANPSISLSPSSGGAGTQVTASGSGFPANVTVAVFLAPLDTAPGRGARQQYVAGTTDSSGRYALTFTMSGAWSNGGQITQDRVVVTVATPDFSVAVSSVFAYLVAGPTATSTPSPTPTNTPIVAPTAAPNPFAQVSPGSGGAGTIVTVSGGGFPANTMLYAHLARLDGGGGSGSSYARYASAVSDGAGNFVMTFVMPATWPNGAAIATQRLVILVAPDDFTVEASATFSYQQVASSGDAAPTPTHTVTPAPPTSTPTSTGTATPEPPTATPEPPTSTPTPEPPAPAPTDTPAPAPTDTPVPAPTDTPVPTPPAPDTPTPTATTPSSEAPPLITPPTGG